MTSEKADLLQALAQQRFLFRRTVRDLDDERAAKRTTVSELTLGGLIKHVATIEAMWIDFVQDGPSAMSSAGGAPSEEDSARWTNQFRMADGETLAGLLADYDEVALRTEEVVTALPDLDAAHPLPPAPWFEPGAKWSARRVLVHIVAETSQHAGHADIIRESLDGAKSMG
jgi:uncharacterized damage-inducible protein DinB